MPITGRSALIGHRGLRGTIERMFGGFITDHHEATAESAHRVVAVVVPNAHAQAGHTVAVVRKRKSGVASDVDVLATAIGPRIYPLPNSPTGWGESHHGVRASYGDALHDPARPEGLIANILGLGPDDGRR